jgi:hypothetical protein
MQEAHAKVEALHGERLPGLRFQAAVVEDGVGRVDDMAPAAGRRERRTALSYGQPMGGMRFVSARAKRSGRPTQAPK